MFNRVSPEKIRSQIIRLLFSADGEFVPREMILKFVDEQYPPRWWEFRLSAVVRELVQLVDVERVVERKKIPRPAYLPRPFGPPTVTAYRLLMMPCQGRKGAH